MYWSEESRFGHLKMPHHIPNEINNNKKKHLFFFSRDQCADDEGGYAHDINIQCLYKNDLERKIDILIKCFQK